MLSEFNFLNKKTPGPIQLYHFENYILISGKTKTIKDQLLRIGRYNPVIKCWVINCTYINQATDIVNQVKEAAKKKRLEQFHRLLRLQKIEPEAPFIRHIDRLSFGVIND